MPKISHDNKQFYKSKIRSLLAMDHSMSARELVQQLEENGIHLDQKYARKLRDEIDREKTLRTDRKLLNYALSSIEDTLTETIRLAWQIALNSARKPNDRISAMREIRKAHVELFNLLFDAGVFDRKLGSIEHTIRNAPLSEDKKVAIRSAFEKWGLILPEPKNDAGDNAAGTKK